MRKRIYIYGVILLISGTICLIILGGVSSKSTIKKSKNEQRPKPQTKLYEYRDSKDNPDILYWDSAPDNGYLPIRVEINTMRYLGIETVNKAVQTSNILFKAFHGERLTATYKRYKVTLINDKVWLVRGYNTFVHSTLMIQKSDGRVLHLSINPNQKGNKHYHEDMKKLLSGINKFKRDKSYIEKYGYTPDNTISDLQNGIIEDAKTAAEIGFKILYSNEGNDIYKRLPLIVKLRNKEDIWEVCLFYDGWLGWGGVFIQKSDGRILHGYAYK